MDFDIKKLSSKFFIWGDYITSSPYGNGHINDTFCSVFRQAGREIRYIHQCINSDIFQNPEGLMNNIYNVTSHQQKTFKQDGIQDASRRALTLVPTKEGNPFYIDEKRKYWRTYLFIEDSTTYDIIENKLQAYNASKAFGAFQNSLREFDVNLLVETIPNFHNTPKRLEALKNVIREDVCGRKNEVSAEIDFALSLEKECGIFEKSFANGEIPKRVTHNDTKLNNVMIDNKSSEGICVIDLDTVMPGVVHYDFGDLIRTSSSSSAEDEEDVSKVCMRWEMFEAISKGYLSIASFFLNKRELELLPMGGKITTFENGVRFLTDYLQGDTYFKTHKEKHNLIRCRSQFALVRSIDASMDKMKLFIDKKSYSL